MDQNEAAELLRQRFGSALAPRLAEQLLRRTDSDPTLLAQVLDQVDPAADGLRRVPIRWPSGEVTPIDSALDSLDATSRQVVELGAVIGREFDLGIIERAAPELDVLSGLDSASGLVEQLPGHIFSFRRALIREVCYDRLGPRRRAELHEQVANALTALGATSGVRAATVVELALHLSEAAALGGGGRLDAAAAAAATAGATATTEGVHDVAAEYFGQAATLAGRAGWAPAQAGRLMVAAGTARLRAARSFAETQVGRAALTGALRMGLRAEDPGLVAAAALGFGPRPTLGSFAAASVAVSVNAPRSRAGAAPVDAARLDALSGALSFPTGSATVELAGIMSALDPSVEARLLARLALEADRVDLAVRANTLAHESGDPRALAEAGLAIAELTGDTVSLDNAEREAAALADPELVARAFDLRGGAGLTALAELTDAGASALAKWYSLRASAALSEGDDRAAACGEALAAGKVIDPFAAKLVDSALRSSKPPRGPDLGALTAREREVLSWALRGTTSREIAEGLVLAERTVETHLANIYRKLGVSSRVELIMKFR